MIAENQKTFYVLMVEGREIAKSENKGVVELAKSQLSNDQQQLAEVKQVGEDGKQVLWG